MAGWAEAGGGAYFDASSADELVSAISSAISGSVAIGTPFRVVGSDGELSGHGTVGRRRVKVEPGTYRVEILGDPLLVVGDVAVGAGKDVMLTPPEPA